MCNGKEVGGGNWSNNTYFHAAGECRSKINTFCKKMAKVQNCMTLFGITMTLFGIETVSCLQRLD